jgi:hypothetical protein
MRSSALHANKRALHRSTKYQSPAFCKFQKRMQRAAAALIVLRVDISAGSDEERANAKARSRRRLAQADRTLKTKCGLQPLNVQNETGLQRLLSKAQAGSGRCTNCCACKQRQRVAIK